MNARYFAAAAAAAIVTLMFTLAAGGENLAISENNLDSGQSQYDLTQYLGRELSEMQKEFPLLSLEYGFSCNRSYTDEAVSCGTIVFQSIGKELVTSISITGSSKYSVEGITTNLSEEDFQRRVTELGYSVPVKEMGNTYYENSHGRRVSRRMNAENSAVTISMSLSRQEYLASPSDMKDENDLASYMGCIIEDVTREFPNIQLYVEEQQVIAENEYMVFSGTPAENGVITDSIITRIWLKEKDGPYKIYGVAANMGMEEQMKTLEETGLAYEGGSGEYLDAERNIFDCYSGTYQKHY